MTLTFKAKTNEGFIIKVLSELLNNIIKAACFEISSNGIHLRMCDSNRHVLIDIELCGNKFNIYTLQPDNKVMFLGINPQHLYKMLKSIKKKDALTLMIDDLQPDKLCIIVHPKENNRVSTSNICIQMLQNVNISLPNRYSNPVNISSGDFLRALKDMNNIGNKIIVNMKRHSLNIVCTNGIFSRDVQFGELDDDTSIVYCEEFNMDQFTRILKIAGLSKHLQIFAGSSDTPLKITSDVGNLGTLTLYIKSLSQITDT